MVKEAGEIMVRPKKGQRAKIISDKAIRLVMRRAGLIWSPALGGVLA
jgi:hypothetical protein